MTTTPSPEAISDERLAELIAYVLDADDLVAAEEIGNAIRELQRLRAGGWRPYRVYGNCSKHFHMGHFPEGTNSAALGNPPVESVCPWCERKPHSPATSEGSGG